MVNAVRRVVQEPKLELVAALNHRMAARTVREITRKHRAATISLAVRFKNCKLKIFENP
jgi:hypothetical protein